ncbi:hypothetical protein BVX98_01200 [bacterium F11]|nr:hypothetical protein BVX98_01200 [bacterium F11]
MIFPNIRCSDLERDLTQKREAFLNSKDEFFTQARKELKPLTLIKRNPKWMLLTFFGAFSGWKLLFGASKKILFRRKSSIIWKILKAGWTWKLLQMGLMKLIKKNGPYLTSLGVNLFKSYFAQEPKSRN